MQFMCIRCIMYIKEVRKDGKDKFNDFPRKER